MPMVTTTKDTGPVREHLKSLGLTKYEALVYIALLRAESASATKIHEISGVPRASVYPVLDKLIKKGLVSVSNTTPKQFDAVPPDEGLKHLLLQIERDAEAAKKELVAIYQSREDHEERKQEMIWTLAGRENIENRISDMLANAASSVIIFGARDLITPRILDLIAQVPGTVAVDIATDGTFAPGALPPNVRVRDIENLIQAGLLQGEQMAGVFIADRERLLLRLNGDDISPSALYSESPAFLQLFLNYWNHITTSLLT
ncbi:MAG TPA: TrmB family transcriptional regulator [Methanoculleus sp.]|nr:TrmB family transcriptional regulator [Methanoculleus sp.]